MLEIKNFSKLKHKSRILLFQNLIILLDKQIAIRDIEIVRLNKMRKQYQLQIEAHKFLQNPND